jgi:hypothetical protein
LLVGFGSLACLAGAFLAVALVDFMICFSFRGNVRVTTSITPKRGESKWILQRIAGAKGW